MKDLNLNELLRYFIVGVFAVILLYLLAEKSTIDEHLNLLGNGDVFGIFSFLSLTFGTIIYVIYRAILYPLFNIAGTWWVKKKINQTFPETVKKIKIENKSEQKSLSISSIISFIDHTRWEIKNESVKKSLSEWASQVHFLFNLSISCLIVIFIFNNRNTNPLWLLFSVLFIVSIIHFIRYKNKEILELKYFIDNKGKEKKNTTPNNA